MGSKQKPVKKDNKATAGIVVVSKSSGLSGSRLVKKWRALNPYLRYTIVGAVLLVGVLAVVLLAQTPAPEQKAPLPANVDTDYSDTELTNYPLLLKHDYNLTEDDIMHGNLKKELKIFDEANNIAIAIARLGDRHRSLDAYRIAVGKAPKDIDDSFYITVMGISYQMGDPKYGDQMYQKAQDVVNGSKMTAAEKRAELYRLKNLYELSKAGEK